MDVSALMHSVEAVGDHTEDKQDVDEAEVGVVFESDAVEKLHREEHFADTEHPSDFSELEAFSDVGAVDVLCGFEFGFDLFEDA